MSKNTTLSELKKSDYFGQDASLEISLFEYGIICKDEGETFTFIYSIGNKKFDTINDTKEGFLNPLTESWFKLDRFLSFIGEKEIPNTENYFDFFNLVASMVNYYGYENIFGSSYLGFEIEND